MREVTAGTFRTSVGGGWLPLDVLSLHPSEAKQSAILLAGHSSGEIQGRGVIEASPAKGNEKGMRSRDGSAAWHGPWRDSPRQRTADGATTVVAHLNPLKQWRKRVVKAAPVGRSPQGDILQADFDDKKFDPVYPARWRIAMQGDDAEAKSASQRQHNTHIIKGSSSLNTANDGELRVLVGRWSVAGQVLEFRQS